MAILEIKILYFQSFKIKHEFKKKGGRKRWVNGRTKLACVLLISGLSSSKGGDVEAMTSKITLMMPKNQELSKFQRIRSQKTSRIKFQRIKIQEQSSFKNQDSRIIKIEIQDSRFKNQEKTQSR